MALTLTDGTAVAGRPRSSAASTDGTAIGGNRDDWGLCRSLGKGGPGRSRAQNRV